MRGWLFAITAALTSIASSDGYCTTTHCFYISGIKADLVGAYEQESKAGRASTHPFMLHGRPCAIIGTWEALETSLKTLSPSHGPSRDQILIYQQAHGQEGGGCKLDGEGNGPRAQDPEKILDVLQLASNHWRVGAFMHSCFSGDLIEKLLRRIASKEGKLKREQIENLCLITASVAGHPAKRKLSEEVFSFPERLEGHSALEMVALKPFADGLASAGPYMIKPSGNIALKLDDPRHGPIPGHVRSTAGLDIPTHSIEEDTLLASVANASCRAPSTRAVEAVVGDSLRILIENVSKLDEKLKNLKERAKKVEGAYAPDKYGDASPYSASHGNFAKEHSQLMLEKTKMMNRIENYSGIHKRLMGAMDKKTELPPSELSNIRLEITEGKGSPGALQAVLKVPPTVESPEEAARSLYERARYDACANFKVDATPPSASPNH